MSVLDRLAQEAHATVEAGGLEWRVRGVRSELVREGQTLLLSLAAPSEEDILQERVIASLPDAAQEAARASWAAAQRVRRLTPELAARSAAQADAVVMAAVVAVREVGATAWDPARIVPEGQPIVEGETTEIPLDVLSGAVRQELFAVAWDVTTRGGRDAERLARFRRGRREHAAPREAVPDVRPPAA